MPSAESRLPLTLLGLVGLALMASALAPYDRATWWMEVAPVLIVAPLLVATHRRFPLTTLLQVLIAAHALVLIVGGTWTYARVPLGFWLQDVLALDRNPYDRIGHLMQGFVPAIAAREILLRHRVLREGGWLFFVVTCVCLAISAVYELVEWAAAVALGQGAEAFLGTQGDPWDTQSDMAMALLGAVLGMTFAYWLDRRYVHFDVRAVWWAQVLKTVLGLAITIGLRAALKAPLLALCGGHNIANLIRYALMVIFAAGIWPMTFGWFGRLGRNKPVPGTSD